MNLYRSLESYKCALETAESLRQQGLTSKYQHAASIVAMHHECRNELVKAIESCLILSELSGEAKSSFIDRLLADVQLAV